jgi:hypothetical protein
MWALLAIPAATEHEATAGRAVLAEVRAIPVIPVAPETTLVAVVAVVARQFLLTYKMPQLTHLTVLRATLALPEMQAQEEAALAAMEARTVQEAISRAAQETRGLPETQAAAATTVLEQTVVTPALRETSALLGPTVFRAVLATPVLELPMDQQVPRAIQEA